MRAHAMRIAIIALLASFLPFQPDARAWNDNTHLTIAEAAGFELWYSAAAPDVAKSKEMFYPVESLNHFCNNSDAREVTPGKVKEQAERYNKTNDCEGHLYGALLGSVRDYLEMKKSGKYARYPLVFCAHYCGDLSMPLHNTPGDDFNKSRHGANDAIVENSVRGKIDTIRQSMKPPRIDSEDDLARAIASVGESARQLGITMRNEKRDMTADEAYGQIIRSASLFNAILAWTEKMQEPDGGCGQNSTVQKPVAQR